MQATTFKLRGATAELVAVRHDDGRGMLHLVDEVEQHDRNETGVRLLCAFDNAELGAPKGVLHGPSCVPAADLAYAVAALGIAQEGVGYAGEVAFDGRILSVRGVLPFALAAKEAGLRAVVVPDTNAQEAAAVDGLRVLAVRTLAELHANELREVQAVPWSPLDHDTTGIDLADIRAQLIPRRALEIAAAGHHALLLVGPPGTGKTMLARRLTTILPPLSREEAVEVSAQYSARGLIQPHQGLLLQRPFRAPHYTCSTAALAGGGAGMPRSGEVTLAHRGVLFLEELPEFQRATLDSLRGPLRDGYAEVGRRRVRFPSETLLVAAMNPCPCGYLGHERNTCRCTPPRVQSYQERTTPLLELFDLRVAMPSLSFNELSRAKQGEPSNVVRQRVVDARAFAVGRANVWTQDMQEMAWRAAGTDADRVRRVARTIADLEASHDVLARHVAEAVELTHWSVR